MITEIEFKTFKKEDLTAIQLLIKSGNNVKLMIDSAAFETSNLNKLVNVLNLMAESLKDEINNGKI